MSRRLLHAVYDDESRLLAAIEDLRAHDLEVEDVFSPYPVHGLDETVGIRATRIGWVCAIVGLSGAASALAFQEWVSVKSWALDVGGKPFDSLPAFVPVVFEVGVLTGGLASVLALFLMLGLYPGKRAKLPNPRVTDDLFVVVLDASRGGFDLPRAKRLLLSSGATEVEEVIENVNDFAVDEEASPGKTA